MSPTVLTPKDIQARIDRLPRLPLAVLPTPLQACPRLSERLGVRLLVKRDDLTGLAFGGNKTRHFELVFAEAQRQGATVFLTGAATQSNLCRQAAAAAVKLGMKADLTLLHGVKGPRMQGNFLLYRLLGARVEVLEDADWTDLQDVLESKAAAYRDEGEAPFVFSPVGPLCALGSIAYVEAFLEMERQCEELAVEPSVLFVAAANVTPAGLALGAKLRGASMAVQGVTPIRWPEPRAVDVARIATAAAKLLDLDVSVEPHEILNDDGYVGEGYGIPSPAAIEAMRLAAQTEGLILDPVYTGKAFAALLDYVRTGRVPQGSTVVFLHTGGQPALFAYDREIAGE